MHDNKPGLKLSGIGNPSRSFQEGSDVIHYAFLKNLDVECDCHVARDKTKTQFILINCMITACFMLLTLVTGNETKQRML